MRTLSSAALRAMFAQETGQLFLVLLTLDHPSLDVPIRVTSDGVKTFGPAGEHLPFPFQLELPDDREDQIQQARLTIDAIDLSLLKAIRSIGNTPPTVKIEVVLATPAADNRSAEATSIEAEWTLTLRNVQYDAMTISGTLAFEDVLNEQFPRRLVTPATLPGAFEIA